MMAYSKKQESGTSSVNTKDAQRLDGDNTLQFADNRSEAITQRKLATLANNSSQVAQLKATKAVVHNSQQGKATQLNRIYQRKYDHLFNDIPKTLRNMPDLLKNPAIQNIWQNLDTLRNQYGVDNQHQGQDQNSVDYGSANAYFKYVTDLYGDLTRDDIKASDIRGATVNLWKYSVDEDVGKTLNNPAAMTTWKQQEKPTFEAIVSTKMHSSALKNQ